MERRLRRRIKSPFSCRRRGVALSEQRNALLDGKLEHALTAPPDGRRGGRGRGRWRSLSFFMSNLAAIIDYVTDIEKS